VTPEDAVFYGSLLLFALALTGLWLLRDPDSRLSRRLDDAIDSSLTTIPKDVLS